MSYQIENISEGVTADFYWYELSLAKAKLQEVQEALDRIVKASEAREKERVDYVTYLLRKLDKLQVELNTLRKE